MNTHALLDEATIRLSALLLGSKKLFAESIETDPLVDVLEATTVPTLDIEPDTLATDEVHEIQVETPTETDAAAYSYIQYQHATRPTIIFHHGSGENPFSEGRFVTSSVDRLFGDPEDIKANIVAVRAPYHDRSAWAYTRAMGDMADFVGMLAASAALVEAITRAAHAHGAPAVVVSGISLGGWVTTLHQAVHDSAEMYAPLLAGDRMGEMFAASTYRRMTGWLARENTEWLVEALDYPEAYAAAESATRPLLARYDRIIAYPVQRDAFDRETLAVIDYGHVTGSLQAETLRDHVVRAMIEAPVAGGG